MNQKTSVFIIFLIFALPILLYFVVKGPGELSSSSIAEAKAANYPKVLHFSQSMCSECRDLEKIMKPVEEEYSNKINFVHLDVSKETSQIQDLVKKYNVKVVPTLVFINKKGKVVNKVEGSMPKETLEGYLDRICN